MIIMILVLIKKKKLPKESNVANYRETLSSVL